MSKRRMFSHSIVESDAFLDMPLTTQALYLHLCMNADDDGFVNPKRVVRMVGGNEDDLKLLIAKRFLLTFSTGVVVIKHWNINNFIRNDRYSKTTYTDELSTIIKNENNAYTEKSRITTVVQEITDSDNQSVPNGIPNDIPVVHLDKVSIGKVSINTTNVVGDESPETKKVYGNLQINELFDFWHSTVGYPISGKHQANRNACSNLLKKHGIDKLKLLIKGVELSHEDQYAPRIADFCSLQTKLNDLVVWGRRHRKKAGIEVIS